MAVIPLSSSQHFRAEMGRIIRILALQLLRQRRRGRSPAADAVRGFVIEDGEAEGLIAELAAHWTGDEPRAEAAEPDQAIGRGEVGDLAAAAASAGVFLPLVHAIRNFALTPDRMRPIG
jgi:hypothetical protein